MCGNNDSQLLSHMQWLLYPCERSGEDYRMPINNSHLKQWPLRDHENCDGVLTIVFCFLNRALTPRFVSWHMNNTRWHQRYPSFILLYCHYCPRRKWALWMSPTIIFLVFIQSDTEKWGARNFLWNIFSLRKIFPWSNWMWSSGNHNYRHLFSTWWFVVAT